MCTAEKENELGEASRILEHPILGEQNIGKKIVEFTFDGKTLKGYEGEPIAAALKAAGVQIHRYTQKKHKPRGIFCAIGRCTDCVMIVDGKPNIRTCMTPLKAGMDVKTQYGVSPLPFDQQK
ncbi:(2Fe-2S)-binding protein [Acidaminococcus fermentans]|uniref:(2Fe-2S)-binding protein n=1 Tax=Acidaminococcus fermentans TaxID=905 RepID=A0A6N7VY02_ACIFE|nr:(2Fe-2S)-binding protein [Acidaminococcus fermentans]MSS81981.1 (2Fe-2S)-binding protein [Acidaminococcus fermentans]